MIFENAHLNIPKNTIKIFCKCNNELLQPDNRRVKISNNSFKFICNNCKIVSIWDFKGPVPICKKMDLISKIY